MFDLIAIGEILIDFTGLGGHKYEAHPGGAPCNALAAAAKLGKKTAFIGKVGKDAFGMLLRDTLCSLDIDVSCLYEAEHAFTTLAFVSLDEKGNRTFSFSRHKSADLQLCPEEIREEFIASGRILHCGSLSLCDEPSRSATLKAIEYAKKNHVLVSVDPNLREPLWATPAEAAEGMRIILAAGDIIKISDYEMEFLYGTSDPKESIARLRQECDPKLIFLTCGPNGAYLWKDGLLLHQPCFDVKTIDTTGAGDSFDGAVLTWLLEHGLDPEMLTESDCAELLRFANAAASLTTMRHGAIPSLPNRAEVEELLAK